MGGRTDGRVGALVAPEPVVRTNGQPPGGGPRSLRRRRGLPGGRAVVGGLLVAASAVGLFAAYAQASARHRTSYVVARHALAPGARLGPSDLSLSAMDLPAELRARAFRQIDEVAGTTLVAPLAAGELVQASALVATRPGGASRVLSFPIERSRVGPLKPGERVDVLATFGTGADAFTTVVLSQALIVEVDRSNSALGDTGSVVITVGVDDPAHEVALAHAVQLAKLTVVAATGAPALTGPPPTYRTGPTAAPGGR
ncbi:MAG TPA: SAF domain-containing protein [Acidimicrobiales bacterium]|nr:SAF domain-containing protein [Acidimicrobiales bacterium]